jgi:hypothetical protein
MKIKSVFSTKTLRLTFTLIFCFNLFILDFVKATKTESMTVSNYKLLNKKAGIKLNTASSAQTQFQSQIKQEPPQEVDMTGKMDVPIDPKDQLIDKSKDLPDLPLYHQGWVKYFRYMDVKNKPKPNKFFKNPGFEQQQKGVLNGTSTEADEIGPLRIQDEKHFFAVLYKDALNILNSRDNHMSQVIDTLNIDFIKTIPEDNNYAGGVKDFGTFSEGSCFQVQSVRPNSFFIMTAHDTEPADGFKEVWLLCSDNETEKRNLMNLIIQLKLKKQHQVGAYIYVRDAPKNGKREEATMSDLMSNDPLKGQKFASRDEKPINDPNITEIDGYWVMLQDWSACTLKCGGGKQYKQLMCMPPKQGGKPCPGASIRERECNPEPCPTLGSIKDITAKKYGDAEEKLEKPIVKVMPLSTRPQRYDKCFLKEGDALMVKNDKTVMDFERLPKVPIRLVMNNKSVTAFQDDSLQTNLGTFMLKSTTFTHVTGDNATKCFILNGNNLKAQFCQLDGGKAKSFVDEWDYDFNLFKNQCKEKRQTYDLDMSGELKRRVEELKQDMVSQKKQTIKEREEETEEVQLEKKVANAQSMTLLAIEKEDKLEKLLEQEEAEKEREQQEELREQFANEKKKNDCLLKTIKEKQMEEQTNIAKANANVEIERVKQEAQQQIIIKRMETKNKIEQMRKRNSRKLSKLNDQIQTLRVETAENLSKATKKGDASHCTPPHLTKEDLMEEYCQLNFSNDLSKFSECKNTQTFCFTCCGNEFGELNLLDRDACYKKCDAPQKVEETPKEGDEKKDTIA